MFSRIGYDLSGEKRIIISGDEKSAVKQGVLAEIVGNNQKTEASPKYWGEKWRKHWWVIDISDLKKGDYECRISEDTIHFSVKPDALWEDTWKEVSIVQLQGRVKMREENSVKMGPEFAQGGGWQDCGGSLRETNSHATMLIGLMDMLEFSPNRISQFDQNEIRRQMIIGLDYIAYCQEKGKELGKGEGAIIHEWPRHKNVITGDVAKGALCFARASRVLKDYSPEKAKEYQKRAVRSFDWLDENGSQDHPGGTSFRGDVLPDDGFHRIAYGAPEGYKRPEEWMTRDLVTMTWTALELAKSGKKKYKKSAVKYADQLMARQIAKDDAEGGFYGHFRVFSSSPFSEKAWSHHHMGFDAGATFPHYLVPLIEMSELWAGHPKANSWKKTVNDFAYGYFLPACNENPFRLLPMGYFKNEGILTFSGLWHGMNGAYGSAAALALDLEKMTGDKQFGQIATGNLQWIAGLNAGVKEQGKFVSKSMIYGIGQEYIGSWTKLEGTICNGFESDRQFQFTEPKKENDGPFVFTDEGWITHSGGWLSAISRLVREKKSL
ncbi:glycoside hydrolase family 9 protein [Fulvitalea axinellae]|uniref:glycoside hydrolase family 9 protein n=1 Tax=Fulvitalea axinellae TaxID=1182444 RepID=UPI0030CA46D7